MSDAPEQIDPNVATDPAAASTPIYDATATASDPTPAATDPAPADVPAPNSGPRPNVRDHLRKQQIQTELVDFGDGFQVEVRGLSSKDAYEMGQKSMAGLEPGDEPDPMQATATMMRSTCFDPIDGTPIYGSDPSNPETYWSDEDIINQPVDITNKLAAAGNKVLGRDGGPGKE